MASCWRTICGPGDRLQQRQSAEEHRHRARAGNAEDERRDQRAAVIGVGRGFRADHAADVALPEHRAVLGRLDGVAVGDPVHDRAAEPGNDADHDADARRISSTARCCCHQSRTPCEPARAERVALGDALSSRSSETISGMAYMPSADDDELQAVDEIGHVVGRHAQAAARARRADRAGEKAEPGGDDALERHPTRRGSPPSTGRGPPASASRAGRRPGSAAVR